MPILQKIKKIKDKKEYSDKTANYIEYRSIPKLCSLCKGGGHTRIGDNSTEIKGTGHEKYEKCKRCLGIGRVNEETVTHTIVREVPIDIIKEEIK